MSSFESRLRRLTARLGRALASSALLALGGIGITGSASAQSWFPVAGGSFEEANWSDLYWTPVLYKNDGSELAIRESAPAGGMPTDANWYAYLKATEIASGFGDPPYAAITTLQFFQNTSFRVDFFASKNSACNTGDCRAKIELVNASGQVVGTVYNAAPDNALHSNFAFSVGSTPVRIRFRSTADGISAAQAISELRVDRLTFVSTAPPVVESIQPLGGPKSGGTVLTLHGSNFIPTGTQVNVGGQPCIVQSMTSDSVTVVVPPLSAIGAHPVAVTTPNGSTTFDSFHASYKTQGYGADTPGSAGILLFADLGASTPTAAVLRISGAPSNASGWLGGEFFPVSAILFQPFGTSLNLSGVNLNVTPGWFGTGPDFVLGWIAATGNYSALLPALQALGQGYFGMPFVANAAGEATVVFPTGIFAPIASASGVPLYFQAFVNDPNGKEWKRNEALTIVIKSALLAKKIGLMSLGKIISDYAPQVASSAVGTIAGAFFSAHGVAADLQAVFAIVKLAFDVIVLAGNLVEGLIGFFANAIVTLVFGPNPTIASSRGVELLYFGS